jgi:glycosyltransferase involved in cell wall biosynthesis
VTAFALAAYPISGAFRRRIEELAGEDVEVVVLPELRRLGAAALVRRLRGLRGRCFLALEDAESATLLPILEGIAAATRARTIEIVDRDLTLRRVSRLASVAAAAPLAAATVDAQLALRAARRDLDTLLGLERTDERVDGERVLYLNANLWFGVKAGGSIAHVAGVVNALVDRGYDLTLATAPDPVGVTAAADVVRLVPPRHFGLPVESNLYRFGRTVPRQLRAVARPSFVYQRLSVGSYAGAALARRHGVPLVLEYNGSEVWVARNWGRGLRYEALALDAERAGLRHASLVVTISQALTDEVVDRGVEPERVVWHPNGVDAATFAPDRFSDGERVALRRRYGIDADATVVGFVGTFGQWHGADVLARAVARSAEWARSANVRYLLVGDGMTMPIVRQELAGAEDVAVLTGVVPQADAPLHLAAADVLVSPHVPNADGSPFFGSPTKLFEYMAAEKPIVASDLDQIGDVLRDDLAVLVPPGDADALAAAIRELVGDPERRARLGERARRRVLERYTWRHHVDAVLERLPGR